MRLFATLLFGLAACSHASQDDPLARLRALESAAACSQNDQCRTVALGAKPCGGPEGYLAWSSASADARQVQALAERYRRQRVAENARSGLVSDCQLVTDPGAVCQAGQCRLGGKAER